MKLTQNTEEVLPVVEVNELENPDATGAPVAEMPSEAPIDPLLSTLPPEAQGETNGGPLGCCLGTVAGLFLTLAVILLISIVIGNGGYLGWATGTRCSAGHVSWWLCWLEDRETDLPGI